MRGAGAPRPPAPPATPAAQGMCAPSAAPSAPSAAPPAPRLLRAPPDAPAHPALSRRGRRPWWAPASAHRARALEGTRSGVRRTAARCGAAHPKPTARSEKGCHRGYHGPETLSDFCFLHLVVS